jgi:aminopeptidase
MRDPRIDALAQILVYYSAGVNRGETCAIQSGVAAEPLVQAIYEEVLKAGGLPIVQLALTEQDSAFYKYADEEQLKWVSPTQEWLYENVDNRIVVMADVNPRALSNVDPLKQSMVSAARKPLMDASMKRAAAGDYNWVLTLYPTQAYATEAGLSLPEYEDFFYNACLATDPEPVRAWLRQSDMSKRLAKWTEGRKEVHITAPNGTDITLGIEGRHFIPCVGTHNMPDGEFFTGPIEDSVNGHIAFSFPATYGGREVSGVELTFVDGKVTEAKAQQGEEFLLKMLDTDDGARRLGELGIGTNYGITTGTKEILLDEKIGGTVHLALGMSYPETGGVNDSAIHWDLVCDLRQGGRIEVDGELLQENGEFKV